MSQTVKQLTTCLTEVMKSKFIAIVMPLDNPDNFKEIVAGVRKEHKKAKHVVYAYKVGNASKSCDDQEPKGTAGRPLMELLNKRNLDKIAVIVVRYFGGTKLGASRLLRTYVDSANAAINMAELIEL